VHVAFTVSHVSGTEPATDERAAEWLEQAKSGDASARQALLGWAYGKARRYYLAKVDVESALTPNDAEDLTGAFLVEFHRAWPRVCAVRNYTRRMLRNNLNRYLMRKREVRQREAPFAREQEALYASRWSTGCEDHGSDAWNDETWLRHTAIRRVLESADAFTRDLILLRLGADALSYRQIAVRLGTTESALRMRAARFYRSVRDEHGRLKRFDASERAC
jgi:DNA-directed RNA polymerase specialized sigma24 family protein